jgi:hypothetical protein
LAGVELEHALIGQQGLGLATESHKHVGYSKPSLGIIRLELNGLVET